MNKCRDCKKEQKRQNKRFWRGYCFKCWTKLNTVSKNRCTLASKVNVVSVKKPESKYAERRNEIKILRYKDNETPCKVCKKPFVKKKRGASKKVCASCCRRDASYSRWKGGKVKTSQQSINKRMYNIYISSTAWKHFAKALKEERGGKCENCEATTRLTVHHTHYKTLFHEKKSDLLVLCWDCHQDEHPEKRDKLN